MRIAIVSDIHEDIINLELAMQKISRQHCDTIVCLGDISGYNARYHNFIDHRNATGCLQLLEEHKAIIVAGNHDLHSCKRLPYMPQQNELLQDWYQLDHATKAKRAGERFWLYTDELDPHFTRSDIQRLTNLPLFYSIRDKGMGILFSHYLFPDINGFTRELVEDASGFYNHLHFMKQQSCTISFCGHAHVPSMLHFNKHLRRKQYKKKVKLEHESIIMVPPIVRSKSPGGFCIFDTHEQTVIAFRI